MVNCSFNDMYQLSLAMIQTLSLHTRTKDTKSPGLGSLCSGKDRRGGDRPYKQTKYSNYNYTVCGAMGKEKAEHGTGPLEEPYTLDRVNLSEETISQGLKKMLVDKVPTGFKSVTETLMRAKLINLEFISTSRTKRRY